MQTESSFSPDNLKKKTSSKAFKCKLASHQTGPSGWTIILSNDLPKMVRQLGLKTADRASHRHILDLLKERNFSEAMRQIILAELVVLIEKGLEPDEFMNCSQIASVKAI